MLACYYNIQVLRSPQTVCYLSLMTGHQCQLVLSEWPFPQISFRLATNIFRNSHTNTHWTNSK